MEVIHVHPNLYPGADGRVPRTQKARGIVELRENPIDELLGGSTPKFALIQDHQQLLDFIENWKNAGVPPVFCRPCPVRPRHGFVDSGPVQTPGELCDMWSAALSNDPEAELLLMAPIDASLSAIYTPTSLSYGPGNDGATAGNQSQMIFHGGPPQYTVDKIAMGKGIADGEVPYVEVVYDGMSVPRIVQARSGPKIDNQPDFVPDRVVVKEIVLPNGEDLIEWEQRAASFGEGTVIYHPGGNRASHYAIHCVNNNIPYITTFEPEVGRVIEPTGALPPPDVEQFLSGIMAGTSLDIDFDEAVQLMLFGLHTSAFNSTPLSWKISGMAAMQCLRLGAAACLGEYRHHQRGHKRLARRQIFHNAFADFFGHQKRMVTAYRSFQYTRWRSGYGGPKWGECAYQNLFLWMEIMEFVKSPTAQGASHVMDALNRAVNVAHNGGWLFNKFAPGALLDQAAQGSPAFLIKALPIVSRFSTVEQHEPDWLRMRKPRVLKIDNDESGVRRLFHKVESHKYPSHVVRGEPKPKPKPKITQIQGVMRNHILHLQYKVTGKVNYKTKDIPVLNPDMVRGLDHKVVSWATETPYIRFALREIPDPTGETSKRILVDEDDNIIILDFSGEEIRESNLI